MKKLNLAIAAALFLTTGASFAASLSITPAAATATAGAGNVTSPTPITVVWDPAGYAAGSGDSIDAQVLFDATKLTASNVTGDCAAGAAGEIIIAAVQLQSNTIPAGTICSFTLTTTAGAVAGNVIPVDLTGVTVGTNGAADAVQPTVNDGTVTIQAPAANPTTVNFAPTTVNLANGGLAAGQTSPASIVAVTTAGGVDPGSYTCTVPAGFQLTNASANNIPANSDPADISVTCTLAAAGFQGTSTCTRTGGANVALTLNCPAGQAAVSPTLTATPPSGTLLTCNGSPGGTQVTGISIQNTGTGPTAGLTCSTVGAGFTVQQQPQGVVAVNGTTNAIVSCSVPANGVTINGTLNCQSANGGNTITFPLASTGQASVAPTQPATIPSTSLWAKIGLVGLLAGLGLLMVGFRRHS